MAYSQVPNDDVRVIRALNMEQVVQPPAYRIRPSNAITAPPQYATPFVQPQTALVSQVHTQQQPVFYRIENPPAQQFLPFTPRPQYEPRPYREDTRLFQPVVERAEPRFFGQPKQTRMEAPILLRAYPQLTRPESRRIHVKPKILEPEIQPTYETPIIEQIEEMLQPPPAPLLVPTTPVMLHSQPELSYASPAAQFIPESPLTNVSYVSAPPATPRPRSEVSLTYAPAPQVRLQRVPVPVEALTPHVVYAPAPQMQVQRISTPMPALSSTTRPTHETTIQRIPHDRPAIETHQLKEHIVHHDYHPPMNIHNVHRRVKHVHNKYPPQHRIVNHKYEDIHETIVMDGETPKVLTDVQCSPKIYTNRGLPTITKTVHSHCAQSPTIVQIPVEKKGFKPVKAYIKTSTSPVERSRSSSRYRAVKNSEVPSARRRSVRSKAKRISMYNRGGFLHVNRCDGQSTAERLSDSALAQGMICGAIPSIASQRKQEHFSAISM